MYTLGIPKRQYRRCTRVLGHESSKPIPYEAKKQEDGFYVFSFPEADEFDFRDIVYLLKRNGITTIGADDQLTEKKIMKIEKLLNEQGSPEENDIIESLEKILERWKSPEYMGGQMDKCERSNQYHEDIRELVEDFTENFYMDLEDTNDVEPYAQINESRSLKDIYLNEQIDSTKTYGDLSPEEWEAEREKTGMKTDDEGNLYIDREYDPGNEPLEIQMNPDQGENANRIFYIEPEDIETYVSGGDVEATNPGEKDFDEVTANENNSNVTSQGEKEIEKLYGVGVDDVRQAYKDEADPMGFLSNLDLSEIGCTEQEIAEGTCGHGKNGKIGRKPAGPHLMKERFQKLANIKKKNG